MVFKKIKNEYNSLFHIRYDEKTYLDYYRETDFGLTKKDFTFKNSLGYNLNGGLFSYPNYNLKTLIIFEHGFGSPYYCYTKEIEKLCSFGYQVLAYNHTGYATSDGKSVLGFSQSLHDLDDLLNYVKSSQLFEGIDNIYLFGHSCGGYSAMNITTLHKEVKKVVNISGFLSPKRIINQFLNKQLFFIKRYAFSLEKKSNPKYSKYDALTSLEKSNSLFLCIYSSNDNVVLKKYHYDLLKKKFSNNNRIKFILLDNKFHNPNYTIEASLYLQEMQKKLNESIPSTTEEIQRFKDSYDWDKMTQQDESVWEEIKSFLKN